MNHERNRDTTVNVLDCDQAVRNPVIRYLKLANHPLQQASSSLKASTPRQGQAYVEVPTPDISRN